LFRQTTAEPGWVLASTRGSAIFLQPAALQKSAGSVLLHEFLHALIEQEAGDHAPLWLREGLVETLAGDRNETPASEPSSTLNAELAHPTTPAASQRAHEVAARMAASLCTRYGLSGVRGFLHTGVPPNALQQAYGFSVSQ
jgi:hypothetical protein